MRHTTKPGRAARRLRTGLMPLVAAAMVACGGDGGSDPAPTPTCPETGPYACKSGETEPLYTFQWALNYLQSYFQGKADEAAFGGGIDLNVESVHRQGIKGQGVNVLVIDTGVDLGHEDLLANADYDMSWNFLTGQNDPSPLLTPKKEAHGTNVAGMIGAAQNGKGVMGMAPLAKLGGVPLIDTGGDVTEENFLDAYGGAAWSRKAHVINGSYGGDADAAPYGDADQAAVRGLKALRDGKGIVFVKSAGNEFDSVGLSEDTSADCGVLAGAYGCVNSGNDTTNLEPNVIVTAALNAKGQASSYSSTGPVLWITGMGGEYASAGQYGELSRLSAEQIAQGRAGDGPTIFSTDIRSCTEGYSRSDANPEKTNAFMRGVSERVPGVKDNPNCDYSTMNGTSSAAPTISGVVALMLSANPALTWRDVRDILRQSARVVDEGYEKRTRSFRAPRQDKPHAGLFDLQANALLPQAADKSQIAPGATQVPVELGWQTNAAGYRYSNWYGFGVPDAAKAVELAQLYKKEPARSRSAQQAVPEFTAVADLKGFEYQKVSLLGTFQGSGQTVDQFQVRLTGAALCLGSLGIAVESPSGTKSLLKMPLDHFAHPLRAVAAFTGYGLGSYAFHGENAQGTWKIYAVASNPRLNPADWSAADGWSTATTTCAAAPADGATAPQATLQVQARVIAQ